MKPITTKFRILAALALLGAASAASAIDMQVNNTTADLPDDNPGDGICHVAGGSAGSDCTLRAAVMESGSFSGSDLIIVPIGAHIVLSIPGRDEDDAATGDLDLKGSVVISTPYLPNVPSATIDANGIDRVFHLVTNGDTTLHNLVITGGRADDALTNIGGGIYADGAGILKLDHCELFDNLANDGGAIFSRSGIGRELQVIDSYLHDNSVVDLGYGNLFGSAIWISHFGSTPAPTTIRNSTISSNTGGVAAVHARTDLMIENSTLTGNMPKAVHVYNANASLNHVTISGSETGYFFSSFTGSHTSVLRNSIIADNSVANCDLANAMFDHNYSLASDASCQLAAGTGNLPNTDPMLKPLAVRHRGSPVRVPATGSPALDSGDPQFEGSGGSCLARDQEFLDRPIEGDGIGSARCDMGAVEREDIIFIGDFEFSPIIW